jgi:hypothetical protein
VAYFPESEMMMMMAAYIDHSSLMSEVLNIIQSRSYLHSTIPKRSEMLLCYFMCLQSMVFLSKGEVEIGKKISAYLILRGEVIKKLHND